MKKKLLSMLLVLSMTAGLAAGCGFTGSSDDAASSSSTDGAASTGKKSVTMSMASDPIEYDPRSMAGADMRQIAEQMYVALLRADANGELQPGCAERWEISEDSSVYTFYLNEDVKWSDGKNVTAQDFVYAWTSALEPEFASTTADQFYDIKNAQKYNTGECTNIDEVGIVALDDYTLEVTMENPTALFLEKVASVKMVPVRQDVVEKYDDPREWSFTTDGLIVNGPFIMTSYQSKNSLVLTKNESYYKADEIALDEIVIKFVEEATTALASFKTDVLDICTSIPSAELPAMLADGSAVASPMLATYYYSFNMDKETQDPAVYEAISKPEVRQALSLAIDRTLITTEVAQGGQTPASGIVPVGITMPDGSDWTDASNYEFVQPTQDLEKAQQLLADAGYPNGEGFPEIEIFYNTSESHQAIAQVVQDMWKQGLGINITLVNKETKVFANDRQHGSYQMARSGNENGSSTYPDILELFVSSNIDMTNDPRYSNAEYDELIAEETKCLDLNEKLDLLRQAEDLLMAEMPVIPIYNYVNVAAVKSNIKNFVQDTGGVVLFEYMDIE